LRLRSNVFKVKEIVVEVVLGFFNRTGFSMLHRLIFSYSSFFVVSAFQVAPAFRAQAPLPTHR